MSIDDETFRIIQKIADEHSYKTFGYLDKKDLESEIWVICLEKLDDFSEEKGKLEHFLRVSVKNRLVNRFKDITKSVRSPCPRCPFYDPGNSPSDCAKYGDDRYRCKKWRNYILSVESRNSLLNPVESSGSDANMTGCFVSTTHQAMCNEVKEIVRERIDSKYKKDFEDLVCGNKLSKQRLKRLQGVILEILENHEKEGKSNANSKTEEE